MKKYRLSGDTIIGVKGETTIFDLEIKDVQVLVTKMDKPDSYNEQYFNVYFIDPMFKTEPLNNLREQIPIENEPKDWKKYLTCQYIEYYA